ncbi:hypothetical protein ACFOU2_23995 [Bacillus songklensis]|uniref:Uncharacterized protein n=1 Tax=Bacillus songklensis TaxID=1069116 RepID=A0ABV8B803_9BACI
MKQTFWRDVQQSEELELRDLVHRTLLDYSKQGIAKLIENFL